MLRYYKKPLFKGPSFLHVSCDAELVALPFYYIVKSVGGVVETLRCSPFRLLNFNILTIGTVHLCKTTQVEVLQEFSIYQNLYGS
jgi:hypothetical protein